MKSRKMASEKSNLASEKSNFSTQRQVKSRKVIHIFLKITKIHPKIVDNFSSVSGCLNSSFRQHIFNHIR
ncbi:MAG: hypothetical protein J6W29_06345 [Neisseriaceae bacterium]|nr:hypothetical protein [Neisseriaceae bacterium]